MKAGGSIGKTLRSAGPIDNGPGSEAAILEQVSILQKLQTYTHIDGVLIKHRSRNCMHTRRTFKAGTGLSLRRIRGNGFPDPKGTKV